MKWLCAMLLTGCVSTSQVGPFVKHVQRDGDFLIVHKCMIILEGDNIHEGPCGAEQIPLRSVPVVPAGPQPVAPPTNPMGPQPVAPPAR